MTPGDLDIDVLIENAANGDASARQELLVRHRPRLKQMVAVHLDRRVSARLDPSDVVQEVFAEAIQKMAEFFRKRPLPFYPWLRQMAWEKLVKLHRRHIYSQRRSTDREVPLNVMFNDESSQALAERLLAKSGSAGKHLVQAELRARLRAVMDRLAERDREVLILRYLEQLSTREMAAVLGISEGAVKVRHLRALQRFRNLVGKDLGEDAS
jgi:RNA polymerase sigma-70 factor (ECF subfamily)